MLNPNNVTAFVFMSNGTRYSCINQNSLEILWQFYGDSIAIEGESLSQWGCECEDIAHLFKDLGINPRNYSFRTGGVLNTSQLTAIVDHLVAVARTAPNS
ncbi:MAG: hypothetical protein ACRC8K_26040, partial [Waterburya sp.]